MPSIAESEHAAMSRPPSIPNVLHEHVEELGFLSLQRRKLLFSREITPRQLARHDRRIAAHRDALRVSPEDSVAIARARMEEASSPWDIMACAWTWIGLGSPAPKEIRDAMSASGEEGVGAWSEALRRLPRDVVLARTPFESLDGLTGPVAAILVDGRACHAALPSGVAQDAARSSHAGVRRAFARHVALFDAQPSYRRGLGALLDDADVEVARVARWTSFLLETASGKQALDAPKLDSSDPFWKLCAQLLEPTNPPGPDPCTLDLWHRAVRGKDDPLQLRGEVPDGFFTGALADEALAGQ